MGALARSLKKRWVHRNKEERERDSDVLEERKMYWNARTPRKLRKLDECSMPSNMGWKE
jgi:hypothetical protein